MKFITVAIRPMIVMAPVFRIHQAPRVRTEKPVKSHNIGRPVSRKNAGAKIEFNTPHEAAHNAIAVKSRVLNRFMSVAPFNKNVTLVQSAEGYLRLTSSTLIPTSVEPHK